jgi:hypothetical protein
MRKRAAWKPCSDVLCYSWCWIASGGDGRARRAVSVASLLNELERARRCGMTGSSAPVEHRGQSGLTGLDREAATAAACFPNFEPSRSDREATQRI